MRVRADQLAVCGAKSYPVVAVCRKTNSITRTCIGSQKYGIPQCRLRELRDGREMLLTLTWRGYCYYCSSSSSLMFRLCVHYLVLKFAVLIDDVRPDRDIASVCRAFLYNEASWAYREFVTVRCATTNTEGRRNSPASARDLRPVGQEATSHICGRSTARTRARDAELESELTRSPRRGTAVAV